MAFKVSPPFVGSTATFLFRGELRGLAWTTVNAVSFYLIDPSGNVSAEHAGTVTAGEGSYTCPTTELDEAGTWKARIRATDGTIVKWYLEEFEVKSVS